MPGTAVAASGTSSSPGVFRNVRIGELVLGAKEREYLDQVIDSHRLSYGPFTRRFETAFGQLHDVAHACFCNSGTSALQLAVAALAEQRGWRPGDEIIVPSVTFVATLNVVLLAGFKPVVVDVLPDRYTLDPDRITAAITPRTRCIIPVHLLGLPADLDPILEVARRHDLAVLEDSCETMFARYRGQPVGSFGNAACFSTYVAHMLVTGVGGFAVTNDADLAGRIRSLMNHGRDAAYLSIDDDDDPQASSFRDVVARRFRFERVGFSFRCTELEAAIGLAQVERWETQLAARRAHAAFFDRELQDLDDVLQRPTVPTDREHAYMVYSLVARASTMWPLLQFLEQRGIETRPMLPLIHQPVYQALLGSDVARQFPVAESLYERAFYIGCHPHLDDDDRRHVIGAIHAYFDR